MRREREMEGGMRREKEGERIREGGRERGYERRREKREREILREKKKRESGREREMGREKEGKKNKKERERDIPRPPLWRHNLSSPFFRWDGCFHYPPSPPPTHPFTHEEMHFTSQSIKRKHENHASSSPL